jgi:hypothetical protein
MHLHLTPYALFDMEIGHIIIQLVAQVVIATVSLWLAMKLTKVEGSVLGLLAATSITALVGLIPIPYIGWILPFIVLLVLISRWTTAEIWPDAVLMVVVSWFFANLVTIVLHSAA